MGRGSVGGRSGRWRGRAAKRAPPPADRGGRMGRLRLLARAVTHAVVPMLLVHCVANERPLGH
eukprot:4166089-Lingulodinium_polyedra.AAC.1